MIEEGMKAPAFNLTGSDGNRIALDFTLLSDRKHWKREAKAADPPAKVLAAMREQPS